MRIIDAKPGAARFVQGKVERLSRDVNDLGSAARASIERVQGARPSPSLASALRCALSTIATLESILNRAEDQPADIAIGPIQALSDDLLMVPGLRIDDQGNLDESIETGEAIALMTNAEAHSKTLSAAFDIRLDQGELHGARMPYVSEWQSKMTPQRTNAANAWNMPSGRTAGNCRVNCLNLRRNSSKRLSSARFQMMSAPI